MGADLSRLNQPRTRAIFVTYEIITEESARDGEVAEHGYRCGGWDVPIPDGCVGEAFTKWKEENVEPEWATSEDGDDSIEEAAGYLKDEGFGPMDTDPSNPDTYAWPDAQQDMDTGAYRQEAAHLEGFTEDEQERIWKIVTGR